MNLFLCHRILFGHDVLSVFYGPEAQITVNTVTTSNWEISPPVVSTCVSYLCRARKQQQETFHPRGQGWRSRWFPRSIGLHVTLNPRVTLHTSLSSSLVVTLEIWLLCLQRKNGRLSKVSPQCLASEWVVDTNPYHQTQVRMKCDLY